MEKVGRVLQTGEGPISQLPDERGLPVQLAEIINGTFQAAIGRTLAVNDAYGSRTMREAILKEVNDLRRYTLQLARGLRGDDRG